MFAYLKPLYRFKINLILLLILKIKYCKCNFKMQTTSLLALGVCVVGGIL